MDPEKAFDLIMTSLRRDPRVGEAKMFGALGAKVGDKYFAMLYKGQLVVKLPAERAATLVTGGDAVPFDPGHGRPMKEWVAVAPDLAARWPKLVEEAKVFVASLPAGKPKPRKTAPRTARPAAKKAARRRGSSNR